jgi:short-subunit dehydrogenase
MRVTLVGRQIASLLETARLADAEAEVVAADLATEAGIATVARTVSGPLRVLVHSAGVFMSRPVAETAAPDWRMGAAVNVHAPMLLTALCLGALRAARGHVVFINSSAGLHSGAAGTAVYAATKHALRAAADALRQEVNAQGIRVLSVFPGRTNTPMQQAVLEAEGRSAKPEMLLSPDDVADMVVAALRLPQRAEVTELALRPSLPL